MPPGGQPQWAGQPGQVPPMYPQPPQQPQPGIPAGGQQPPQTQPPSPPTMPVQQPAAQEATAEQGGESSSTQQKTKIIQSAMIPGRAQEMGSHPSQRGKEDEDLPEMDELPDVI